MYTSSKVKTYNWSSPPRAPWIPFKSRFSLQETKTKADALTHMIV